MTAPGCRSLRWFAVSAVVAATVVACTSSPGDGKTKGSSVTESTQTAIFYLEQARQLVATLAHAVAPGVPVKQTVSDGPPSDCKAPLTGMKYFSISRDFEAPDGQTGDTLLPALTAELKARGFVTSPAEPGGAFTVVDAEKDKKVGLAAMGSPTSSLVRISVATQCGQATAADDDVDMAPSPSSS